jgi:EAL and modified HD-GYP domain-containing signal transduction protein
MGHPALLQSELKKHAPPRTLRKPHITSRSEPFLGFRFFDFLPIVKNVGNTSAGQAVAQAGVLDVKPWRYVARQPSFDREENVFRYELLFRDGLENAFHGDPDEASRATLDRTLLMGLDVLCDGRRAFVNCTRDTLIKGLVMLLPSTTTVVEVLETVPADPDVVAAYQSLKEAGYMLALDDYVANDPREVLAEMADIIKVEMQLTTEEQRWP